MDNKLLFKAIAIPVCASLIVGFSWKIRLYDEELPEPTEVQETVSIWDVIFPYLPEKFRPDWYEPGNPPATEPEEPSTEAVTGPKYTRQELEALDHSLIVYGPGTAADGKPAPYAPEAQEKYGKYGAHFIENTDNVIYLTFDCGYEHTEDGQSLTGRVLDTLKKKNVKALFFITQSYAEQNPELVRRIIDEGHLLGNHSSTHDSMPSLTIDEMESQIMALHDYVQTQFGYTMKYFRPPSGEFSERSLAVAQNLGYETVHWSFAYADWDTSNQPDPREALEKILSCHHDGAIYLFHTVSATNAEVLEDVIEGFWEKGYHLELFK